MSRVFHPPSLLLESHTSYRDNYYNTIRADQRHFHKNMGYFSYFNEKTRREREMNEIYSRKNLSKFGSKIRVNSNSDKKEMCPKLKYTLNKPAVRDNQMLSPERSTKLNPNNSLSLSKSTKHSTLGTFNHRRSSNQISNQTKNTLKM